MQDATRAYQAIMGRADRHMSEHPKGGRCGDCRFCECLCFDEAEQGLADELNAHYGICGESERPFLVSLDSWHEWEDCWCER